MKLKFWYAESAALSLKRDPQADLGNFRWVIGEGNDSVVRVMGYH